MRGICGFVVLAVVAAGCGSATPRPELASAPAAPPRALVLGAVRAVDPSWMSYKRDFSRGFADWFKRNGGFASVLTERPATLPEGSVVLIATITEIDRGVSLLRRVFGVGAVQGKVEVEIQNPAGGVLTRFSVRESYRGDASAREVGALMARRLAEKVAETTRRWARGEHITGD